MAKRNEAEKNRKGGRKKATVTPQPSMMMTRARSKTVVTDIKRKSKKEIMTTRASTRLKTSISKGGGPITRSRAKMAKEVVAPLKPILKKPSKCFRVKEDTETPRLPLPPKPRRVKLFKR